MKYAIALWWWSAKWFAHIGFLKFLEEKNINIKEISWTSMWAIIGWCYSMWMNSKEIHEILNDIKFLQLIDVNFKTWLLKWKKIYDILYKIYKNIRIEDLNIPISIVATNLNTWEEKIFREWYLIDAVMASISLPSILKPYSVWYKKYLDWLLKDNLSISAIRSKRILAFSVIRWNKYEIQEKKKFLRMNMSRSFWSYNYEILYQSFNISAITNEDLNIELAKKNWKKIKLFSPDLWKYTYNDFFKFKEIIKEAYEYLKNNY